MQKPAGTLVVANLNTGLQDLLKSENLLSNFCISITKPLGLSVLQVNVETFPPYNGISISAIISESSITLHTWPEIGYVRILIDSCKGLNIKLAQGLIEDWFQPSDMDFTAYNW